MQWKVRVSPHGNGSELLQAAGMAGGVCTAYAHAAAAIAAFSRTLGEPASPPTITVSIGRQTMTVTAAPAELVDIQNTIRLLRAVPQTGGGVAPSR